MWDINSGIPEIIHDGTRTFVHGYELISHRRPNGQQRLYMYDGLGSVTEALDPSGAVRWGFRYDVFGETRSTIGIGGNEWRFTGEWQDATTDFVYLRARYYDPEVGRFVSQDPFPGVIGAPRSQHRYAYVGNNPVIYADPTGLCGWGIPICPSPGELIGGIDWFLEGDWLDGVLADEADALAGGVKGLAEGLLELGERFITPECGLLALDLASLAFPAARPLTAAQWGLIAGELATAIGSSIASGAQSRSKEGDWIDDVGFGTNLAELGHLPLDISARRFRGTDAQLFSKQLGRFLGSVSGVTSAIDCAESAGL